MTCNILTEVITQQVIKQQMFVHLDRVTTKILDILHLLH